MMDNFDRSRGNPIVTPKPQAEVDDELSFHLERRVQDNMRRGMSPEAARKAALERFGDVDGVRQRCTEMLTEDRKAEARRDWFGDLGQDMRFAIRSAPRAPMFSLLAIATLAVGIGANAAVFGVVKSVLLDALPYRNASELIRVDSPHRENPEQLGFLSAGTVLDIRERQRSLASMGAFMYPRDVVYSSDDAPRVMKAVWAEAELFRTLGVSPIRGALFREEDGMRDTSQVVLLPFATWQELFAGDTGIVGRAIRVNSISRVVIGVLPRDFVATDEETDFYFPLAVPLHTRDPIAVRGSHSFGAVGRLRPGVSAEAAHRELAEIGAELEKLYFKDNFGIGLRAVPLRDAMVGDTKTPLLILLASAGLVLLITCANLAGAQLSRTISRRKEFAVRVSLGAGRARLVRQLLTESALLALVGGAVGLLLATLGLALLRGLATNVLPSYADLSLDAGAVVVTFALALLTGVAFGVGPALSVGRSDPQQTLRDGTRSASESVRARQMRGVLVAGQLALCVSLLAAAGLLARSLWALTTAAPGFNPEQLLTFNVQLPGAHYATESARAGFHLEFTEKLRALPGVTGVANSSQVPTNVTNSNGLFIRNAPWGLNEPAPFILTSRVSDDYFRTLGIPIKQGRVFTEADRADAAPVVVINEAMAQRYFPKGDAVGQHIRYGPPNPDIPWSTIVGVVGSVRNDPAHLRAEPMMFPALRQQPYGEIFFVRTSGDPMAMVRLVRGVLSAINPQLPIHKIKTMRDVIDDGFAVRRLPVVLMTAFGGLALLLASVGVYAMFASMATAREREFGVRVALGSTRGAIARLVLRQGGVWMAIGLAVGTAGVVVATRLLRTQVVGVPLFDPIAIGVAVAILLVCAGVALLVPVRRATRVDPISVLR
ncbi:MAG: ABC transporter permease [Phycisphaerae bacterium]|nr:ABC transporter permease [Gemmatimonadaceae bacterium]